MRIINTFTLLGDFRHIYEKIFCFNKFYRYFYY
jgi:hypothetical protein